MERQDPPPRAQKLTNASRLNPYRKNQAYGVLRSLMKSKKPESVIEVLKESGLRGMGGAGFPVGLKWSFVLSAPGAEKFVVCNADESEPGTFKDRAIMDSHPELVVEGILIACRAVGAKRAIIYIRHEYGAQARKLERAIERARKARLIDTKNTPTLEILHESRRLHLRGGDGAARSSGRQARPAPRQTSLPRLRGPVRQAHPHQQRRDLRAHTGGAQKWSLVVLLLRAKRRKRLQGGGRERCGAKTGGLRGGVRNAHPGDHRGSRWGFNAGRALNGVLTGRREQRISARQPRGRSHDFTPLQEAGSMLVSGALVIIPEGVDMVALAHNVVRFFRDESCGKCVPCRLGTEKLTAFLERVLNGEARASELPAMREICDAMKDTSNLRIGPGRAHSLSFFVRILRGGYRSEAQVKPGLRNA